MRRIKNVISGLIFLWFIGFFSYVIIKDAFLKSRGVCGKAVLIDKTVRVKYHRAHLYYRFDLDGNSYEGNSLEEDLDRVGDSVCIVYLEAFPGINRPLKYFENGDLKCACNR